MNVENSDKHKIKQFELCYLHKYVIADCLGVNLSGYLHMLREVFL